MRAMDGRFGPKLMAPHRSPAQTVQTLRSRSGRCSRRLPGVYFTLVESRPESVHCRLNSMIDPVLSGLLR